MIPPTDIDAESNVKTNKSFKKENSKQKSQKAKYRKNKMLQQYDFE